MTSVNKLARIVSKVEKLPSAVRTVARTAIFRKLVHFVGTAKLDIEELTESRAVVSTKNRKLIQNHIGGVHAAAMALLAESATGFVVGMNVTDNCVPVIKTMTVNFKKRSKGGMRAVATLTPEQIRDIRTLEKGEVNVAVQVTDEAGREPIECTMVWAWTPKRPPENSAARSN